MDNEKFNSDIPINEFYTATMILLLDINSRQLVFQKHLAEQIAKENNFEASQVFDQIEKQAAQMRTVHMEELFARYGRMFPVVLDWLKG